MSIGVTAAVFDARKAKRLHSSSPRCDADDDDFRGPDDVVFLPKGGMAFACGPLWLFRTGEPEDRDRSSSRPPPAPARSASPTAPTASSTASTGRSATAPIKSLDLT